MNLKNSKHSKKDRSRITACNVASNKMRHKEVQKKKSRLLKPKNALLKF